MKQFFYLAAASLLCVSCFSVNSNFSEGKNAVKGEGPVVSKSFELKDFNAICVNGNSNVVFIQSDAWEVTVCTQENIFDELDYKVEDGTLVLQAKDHRTIQAEKYEVTVKAPDLNGIEVNGAADFDLAGGLRTEGDLRIQVNGAGDLDFKGIVCQELKIESNGASDINIENVDVKFLKTVINGVGDVDVTGKAVDASLEVNGVGDIDASGLEVTGDVKKHTSGVSRINL